MKRTWTATHWRTQGAGGTTLYVTLRAVTPRPWLWEVWGRGLLARGSAEKAWQAKLYARRAAAKLARRKR